MAPKEKPKIEIEKSHRDPLLSFNQAVTVDCSDFLGTALISQIYLEGNLRVDYDTVLSLIHARSGGPYDANTLQQDVETLELSKYFRRVRLEVNDDPDNPNAKILTFRLTERPTIDSIDYSGVGSISPSYIADRLKRRNVDLAVGGFFNPAALLDAQAVIRDVMAHYGYPAAQVKVSFESVPVPGANAVNLAFAVTEGPVDSR